MSYTLLESLLYSHKGDILLKEKANRTRAYLYPVGEYWIAFDKSAYQLYHLCDCAETNVMFFNDDPFPLVVASITEMEFRNIVQTGSVVLRDGGAYKV